MTSADAPRPAPPRADPPDEAAEVRLARRLMDSMVAFVGLMSADGVLLEANQAALDVAGIVARDVLGRRLPDTYWWSASARERGRLEEGIARAARGETVRYDAEVRVAGDQTIVIDLQLMPLRDADGVIRRIVPSAVDITERRRAEDLVADIVRHAPLGFAQFDRDMRFVRVNDELAAVNGLPADAHIGRTPMELFPDIPSEGYVPSLRAALEDGMSSEFELTGSISPGGPVRTWMERVYPLRDRIGGIVGAGVFVLDITERRVAEDALRASVRTLQQSLLPRRIPPVPGLGIAASYQAASSATDVGGDFYEVLVGPEFGVAAFIGDVCGRGVDAAALTALARFTLVPLLEMHGDSPARAVRELDRIIRRHHPEVGTRYLTLAVATLRRVDGGAAGTVCLGGHPLPVVVRADGTARQVGAPGSLIGIPPHPVDLEDRTFALSPGDALVMFTDGFTEARDPDGEFYGERRLMAALTARAGGTAEQLIQALQEDLAAFTGGSAARDDRAALAIVVE